MERFLQIISERLPDFGGLDLTPLIYALVLGGLVGLEREWHGRPAGLRTHALVCISATMLILISNRAEAGAIDLGETGRMVFDPNRMGAGIVTGIGFLGAVTVLRSGEMLRGLTTAACIWYVAGLGIVLGNREYALGVAGTALVLFVLLVLNWCTKLFRPVIYRRIILLHRREDAMALTEEMRGLLKGNRIRLLDVFSGHRMEDEEHELVLIVSLKNSLQAPAVTEAAAALEGVTSARWKFIDP